MLTMTMCQGTAPLATGSLTLPKISGSKFGASAHDEGGVTSLIKLDFDQYNGNRSQSLEKLEGAILIGK